MKLLMMGVAGGEYLELSGDLEGLIWPWMIPAEYQG